MIWNVFFLQIFTGVLMTIAGILGQIWFFGWMKRRTGPEDFAVFKAQMLGSLESLKELTNRRFGEIERSNEIHAEAILESQGRIGDLRESVQWIKAKINGEAWKRQKD